MKSNYRLFLLGIFSVCLAWTSCDPEDPEDPHEGEVITTLKYALTPTGGGEAVNFTFEDNDGDGGDDPVVTNGTLKANTSYTGVITLEGLHDDHTDDITPEIKEEDEEHQFFFVSDVLTIDYDDEDADGNPLGLSSKVTTKDAGNGDLTIILRHEPAKSADGVKNGDLTNAGGETDIEVSFDITVE